MGNVTALKSKTPTAREMLDGIKVIDVDTHVSEWPDLWTSRASERLKPLVPRMVGEGAERRWVIGEDTYLAARGANSAIIRDGSKVGGMKFMATELHEVHPGTHDVSERLRLMDDGGIHAQVAYPNVLGFGGQRAMLVDEDLRVASIQLFNDAMADMQNESGQRIFPMALLPWWDVEKSVVEAERCAKLGLKGININSDPQDHGLPSLGERHWDRLWDACVAGNLPVNFHIGASDSSVSWFASASWPERTPDEKLALGGVMLFVGNLRVMANILMSRFLERHPQLKIVSVESGAGWLRYVIEAVEYMGRESGIPFEVDLLTLFRRQIYACTFFERRNFVQTIRQVGVDNIMFETDFPHPACLYPDGLDYMVDAIAEMTPEERFKVFSGNAAKVYNIDIG